MLDEAQEPDPVGTSLLSEIHRGRRTAVDQAGDQSRIVLAVWRVDLREERLKEILCQAVFDGPDRIDILQVPVLADNAQVAARVANAGIAPDLSLWLSEPADRLDAIQEIVFAFPGLPVVPRVVGLVISIEEPENLLGDLRQLLVAVIPSEAEERPAIPWMALDTLKPFHLVPGTGRDDHRNHRQPFPGPPLQELGDLFAEDELRGEEVGRDEEDGDAGLGHGVLDLLEPVGSAFDPAVVPDVEEPLGLQNAEVGPQALLPVFVLVAVAQEDGGHGENLLRQDVGGDMSGEF
ncbi:MAG TPA: hypothetical protein VH988_32350 [Thermoanaerobaculia bacterium]|nr:hypothetical protein [Thermoanaerobaculia bacterium]